MGATLSKNLVPEKPGPGGPNRCCCNCGHNDMKVYATNQAKTNK